MEENLLNILSDSNKEIDNQKLMDYISGKLSAEQKHEVETWMVDNPFFNEAVEGLQQAGTESQVKASVDSINLQLRRFLKQRKKKKQRSLPDNIVVYVAVFVILALAVIVFFMIHLAKGHAN